MKKTLFSLVKKNIKFEYEYLSSMYKKKYIKINLDHYNYLSDNLSCFMIFY